MRKVQIALLVLTPLAWIAFASKLSQTDDLDRADLMIFLAAPVLTILLLIVLAVRFANRNAKPS